jgi:hypothetical protein
MVCVYPGFPGTDQINMHERWTYRTIAPFTREGPRVLKIRSPKSEARNNYQMIEEENSKLAISVSIIPSFADSNLFRISDLLPGFLPSHDGRSRMIPIQ